jgi:predicted DNA-binding transcriptional regulator AlpA
MTDEPRRMLTVAQVLEIVPVRRTTLFKMERKGTFPASHYASPNRRFWFADEVAAWQQTLPVNSRILRQARSGNAGSADKPVQGGSDL